MTIYDDQNVVKSVWVKWGKVGDHISGTLIDVREINSTLPGKEGTRVKVYELKAAEGEFHNINEQKQPIEPAVTVEAGEIYLIGGKIGIDAQMRRIKIGQIVALKFTDEKPSKQKGFNPLKIVKVYSEGVMDTEWLEGTGEITAKEVVGE